MRRMSLVSNSWPMTILSVDYANRYVLADASV